MDFFQQLIFANAFFLPLCLGFVVGFILALTGAGGAILSVPLLVFGMGLTVLQAGPIGLLAVTLSAGIGSILGLREKILRYRAASLMALFGLFMSPIGLLTAHHVPNEPLTLIFSLVLFYVSTRSMYQSYKELRGIVDNRIKSFPCHLNQSIGRLIWTVPCARALALAGATAGFFSGLLGVGGGFIIVPSLNRITDLPPRSVIATSMGVLTLVSLGGVMNATLSNGMNWQIAIPFATGSLLGMLSGRSIVKKLPGIAIRLVFSTFALVVAIMMGYKAFHP